MGVMLSVPFPIITLLALFFLLAMALFPKKQRHSGTLRFIIACIVLLTVSTLRWEYDSAALRDIQSGLAMLLPPIAWHSFASMTELSRVRRLLPLFLPPVTALLIKILWPPATDFILFLLFSGYGISLFRMAWRSEHHFTLSRLSELPHTTKMTFLAAGFLSISALADLTVTFDFNLTGGRFAPAVIVIFQAALLPLIGAVILSAGKSVVVAENRSRAEPQPAQPTVPVAELERIYTLLDKQVRETNIYLNPDLTLNVLARKTGIPARQVSGAINAMSQSNVSQWINGFRIERAKALLLSTPLPVTEIMLESGFTTKSNFNREFQRVTGGSPTLFRQQAADNPTLSSEMR